ncbi:hypothetical protein DL93DRAFT_2058266 [Clavulina sp. PMI_390]|nr:hypothetical protein DL93DRAFT_2058266 [Clavulina sp. PMI_390]
MAHVTSGTVYTIINKQGGTVVDLNQSTIRGAISDYGAPQQWEAEPVNKALNLYYIRNVSQGTYLSVQGEPSAGSPVFSTTTKQIWEIRPDALAPNPNLGQVVRIYYQSMNLMLDLSGGSPAPDTPIVMNTVTSPGTNQEWRIEGIIGSKE